MSLRSIVAFFLLAILVPANAANEMRTYYYQWSGQTVVLRQNSVSQNINIGQSACTGSVVTRTFTPGGSFGVTGPIRVYGTAVCVWDSSPTPGAFYSLQRDKDWAFVSLNVLPGGQVCQTTNVPGGGYIRMMPTDAFLEENSCGAGVYRSLGVVIYYTLEP